MHFSIAARQRAVESHPAHPVAERNFARYDSRLLRIQTTMTDPL